MAVYTLEIATTADWSHTTVQAGDGATLGPILGISGEVKGVTMTPLGNNMFSCPILDTECSDKKVTLHCQGGSHPGFSITVRVTTTSSVLLIVSEKGANGVVHYRSLPSGQVFTNNLNGAINLGVVL